MEIEENIAGLGKDHDRAAHDNDLAKKQSEAKPGAENMDMEPHSINKSGTKDFDPGKSEQKGDDGHQSIHNQAEEYARQEHEKADNWENTNETGPDSPQF